MARLDERWHARLENWALWKAGVDTVSRDIVEKYRQVREGNWRIDTSEPPPKPRPLVGQAMDTDRLVKRLDHDHHEAVIVVYVWTYPETLEARAAELGISRDTLHYRLSKAMEALDRMQSERDRQSARMLSLVRAG